MFKMDEENSKVVISNLSNLVNIYNRLNERERVSYLELPQDFAEVKLAEITSQEPFASAELMGQEVFVQVVPIWAHSVDELDGNDEQGIQELFDDWYLNDDNAPKDKWKADLKLVYVLHDWNSGEEFSEEVEDNNWCDALEIDQYQSN
ncbi:hypothetical protein FOD75_11430 (plasmid) [Limosilactobacillus reuteri]|uniref:Uncharacterized protein n=1 Tax=Limosilactobacillus reuteri TaxID=1598 RepID=A0A517D8P4_LIMRT|nr:hypothetical protein [Limosilactobacillus reuteri]QDR73694.1 hypothetical protein FOD75_11430 [Limosilactobacillus reuteri]